MKILLSWLQEFIDITLTPDQIAKTLTMAGLEVDAMEKVSVGCEGVVVCSVLEVEKHPQADKLCLATVTDGKNTLQVVCGAPNCRPGMKTALAPIGAKVMGEDGKAFAIKKSKIRGVESSGMLCAPEELGLSEKSDGIIEFPPTLVEGTDVANLYNDIIFEISLTPNLGHCSSHLGVARELHAATDIPLKLPKANVKENSTPVGKVTSIEVKAPKECPRYACRVLQNVKIGPSPEWLVKRLTACGIRSINNVVDVTNYVMLELGHSLHAFDFDRLAGKRIVVQTAEPGERFVTLDGKERILEEGDLVICDAEKPVTLAGIMGGLNSEVSEDTQNILLEAAYFLPKSIRRTSKRLGLMTDASKRFERGTDPNIVFFVLDRAAALIQEIAGGEICEGRLDVGAKDFPKKRIACRLSRINRLLGTHLSVNEVETIFHKLEFVSSWDGTDVFKVDVPTYRNDIQEEIDLVEEVARVYGFDNIDNGSNRCHASTLPHAPIFLFERQVRQRLISEGLQEFLTCDLIGPSLLDTLQATEMSEKLWVRVLNPVSIEQSILRTSLLPGLLQVIKYNWDHQTHDIAAFEVGRIHFKEKDQYREQTMAAVVLSGKSRPYHIDPKANEVDFYDLKGIVENLLNELKVSNVSFKPSHLNTLHPGRQASIFAGKLEIGSLGELHPAVQRRLDVPQRIYFAEINLHDLFQVKSNESKMRALPIYPGSERDWTLTLAEDTSIDDIFTAIHSLSSSVLENVSLIDIYRSDKLGRGLKNVTLRFLYRDWEKTISQEKVEAEHTRIIENALKSIKKLG